MIKTHGAKDDYGKEPVAPPFAAAPLRSLWRTGGYRGSPWKRQGGEDSSVVSACYRIIPGFDMNNKQNKPGRFGLPGLLFSLLLNDIFASS